jgi:hypothetical protein
MDNPLRVMRERQQIASADLDRSGDESPYCNAAAIVVTTTITTYPTSANAYYACNVLLVTGSVSEGATPTITTDTSTVIMAYNVGSTIPPNGTQLVVHSVGGRWTFRWDC